MLPYKKDNQGPEPDHSSENLEQKRDRERRQRGQRRSWLPTVVFLSFHALLLFLGVVYLIPWIQKKLHEPSRPAPGPVEPAAVEPVSPPEPTPPSPPPSAPAVVAPPPVVKAPVPFPPPDSTEQISKLIAVARKGIKGKVLVVRQDGGGHKTIGEAVKAASDGDVIEIADSGTYNETVVIRGKKNILLRAAKDAKPIIDVANRQAFCIRALSAPGLIVQGISCSRAKDTALSISGGCERAIVAENLAEHSNFGIRATSANVAILANVCGDNRVGIAVEQGPQSVIIDNVAVSSEFWGIKIARSPGTILVNNIVNIARGEEGIKVSLSDNSMILHNTVSTAYKALIRVERSDGVTVMNNILVRCGKAALSFGPTVKRAVCDYNLIDGTDFMGYWGAKQYNVMETWRNATGHDIHSIHDPPQLVDDDADFRLLPDSPARGKASDGTDLGVSWDQSGLRRLDHVLKNEKAGPPGKKKAD
ncbi:MAG: hypothetical protein GXP25_07565 [Planctomycetes bacterium]|nr:hypothetical protein [Planctomycetota bacterium]